MKEQDIKKVKTLIDFEETDKDFEEALEKLDTDDGEEIPELDINISIDGYREYGMIQWSEWTPEQFYEFDEIVIATSDTIVDTVITNNRKLGKSAQSRSSMEWLSRGST